MQNNIRNAIIIGGGIGGIGAGIALRQVGIQIKIYEQAPVLGNIGAGITLWPNAMKVLRKLGVAPEIIKSGTRIQYGKICTDRGATLSEMHPGELEERFGEPVVAIHRADLHRVLLSALPAEVIRLDFACSGFEQENGQVIVRFNGGHSDRADLLIGADGIHSVIRKQLFPEVQLRYSGYTAWRGVVETDEDESARVTLESWGKGARFGKVPIGKNRVYWYATANMPEGRILAASERKVFLQQHFQGWHNPVEQLIEATPADAILHNDIHDFEPLEQWSRGRVTLLGDAAHATTPNMGQGACMAIESAVVLARCLSRGASLEESLRQYESERKPRTAWITRESRKIGRLGQLENPLACALRNLLVRFTPPTVLKKRLETVSGYEV